MCFMHTQLVLPMWSLQGKLRIWNQLDCETPVNRIMYINQGAVYSFSHWCNIRMNLRYVYAVYIPRLISPCIVTEGGVHYCTSATVGVRQNTNNNVAVRIITIKQTQGRASSYSIKQLWASPFLSFSRLEQKLMINGALTIPHLEPSLAGRSSQLFFFFFFFFCFFVIIIIIIFFFFIFSLFSLFSFFHSRSSLHSSFFFRLFPHHSVTAFRLPFPLLSFCLTSPFRPFWIHLYSIPLVSTAW